MKKEDVKKLANELLDKIYYERHLPSLGWTFGGFDKSTRHMGLCRKKQKQIKLSEVFLEYVSEKQIRNTILHEIAHAIDFEIRETSNHDRYWKNIAYNIGCNPKYHVNVNELAQASGNDVYMKYKYVASCPTHGPVAGFMRKVKRKYACGKCSQPLLINQNR